MKRNNQADQPIHWKETLPSFFIVGLVPLLFRWTTYTLGTKLERGRDQNEERYKRIFFTSTPN